MTMFFRFCIYTWIIDHKWISAHLWPNIFLRKQLVWSLVLAFQDDLLPFPWPRSRNHTLQSSARSASPGPMLGEKGGGCRSSGCATDMENPLAMESTIESCSSSSSDTRLDHDTKSACDSSEFLEYKLPPKGVPAGKVLQHAKSVVANLHRKHFGFQVRLHSWSHLAVVKSDLRLQVRSPKMVPHGLIVWVDRTIWTCNAGSLLDRSLPRLLAHSFSWICFDSFWFYVGFQPPMWYVSMLIFPPSASI